MAALPLLACQPHALPPRRALAPPERLQQERRPAKREGRLGLVTTVGAVYRETVAGFEAAFPGITVEHTSLNASGFTPRFLQERQAGLNDYDAMTSTWAIVPRKMADEGYV